MGEEAPKEDKAKEEQKFIEFAQMLLKRGCTSAPGLGFRLPGTLRKFVLPDGRIEYILATGADACKQDLTKGLR